MFFAVAKIGWHLFQPSTLLMWGTLTGALLLATPLRDLGRRLALVAGGLLTIGSMLPIGVLLLRPLENSFPHPSFDETWNPTGIIILGGVLDPSLTQSRGPIALTSAAARVTEGVALAYRFPRARLIFSGGAASLRGSERPEADIARNL